MCNVCIAEQLICGQKIRYGSYVMEAKAKKAEFGPCRYKLYRVSWEGRVPWRNGRDLAGIVGSLGLDVYLDSWNEDMFRRFKKCVLWFKARYRSKDGKPVRWGKRLWHRVWHPKYKREKR
jgi:hypothetical protein